MSFEGRMGAPAPAAPGPKKTESVPQSPDHSRGYPPKLIPPMPAPRLEMQAHALGEEFEIAQAEKVLSGMITPQELAQKYGPKAMEAVMMRIQKKSQEEVEAEALAHAPQPIFPQAPNPLCAIIPRVLEQYNKKNKTEADELELSQLLEDLKKDERFTKILDQYDPLIELYPDRTEIYEMKAMKDFVELNARLSSE